jgi:DNA-binding CsgD family transcriptional regulator
MTFRNRRKAGIKPVNKMAKNSWRDLAVSNANRREPNSERRLLLGHFIIDVPTAHCDVSSSVKLSRREKIALLHFARGLSTPETAKKMNVSESTIATFRRRILKKTGAKNTTEAVAIATAWAMGAAMHPAREIEPTD